MKREWKGRTTCVCLMHWLLWERLGEEAAGEPG